MNETAQDPSATDLSRLHDIVAPDAVSWWPPAPGWYWLAGVLLLLAGILIGRGIRRWKAGAYRREALHALAEASDPAAIAALLRRTALEHFPRSEIAALSGAGWLDWLAATGPEPPSAAMRVQLLDGVYSAAPSGDTAALREWAAGWIRDHRLPYEDRSPE